MISKSTSTLKARLLPADCRHPHDRRGGRGWSGSRRGRGEGARGACARDRRAASTANTSAVAVLAGGCFWGVQGVFQHAGGVTNAISGYAGGPQGGAKVRNSSAAAPPVMRSRCRSLMIRDRSRSAVCSRCTALSPTIRRSWTARGPDAGWGRRYRSAIFSTERRAGAHCERVQSRSSNPARAFSAPIVTKVEAGKTFYPAEDYHQDHLTRHPSAPLHA